jgi:hypothetical protein
MELRDAEVKGSLFLRENAAFDGNVDLTGTTIGGTLEMESSLFAGKVILNQLEAKVVIFLKDGATFHSDVDLTGVTIGGNLEMEGSSFARVELYRAEVKGSLYLWDSTVANIDLSRAETAELDLSHLGWRCALPAPGADAPAADAKAGAVVSLCTGPLAIQTETGAKHIVTGT